ncbi:MAG: GNAT family N-acetyltransferase [Spirochaetales bacterium]|nr:GNAT family N-acetyltransferase [Spirochaetales bacterium]
MTDEYLFRTMATERLDLVKISPQHIDDMFSYASDEETVRYMSWPRHKNKVETAHFIDLALELYEGEMHYDWAIWHREDKKMIGTIGLHGLDREINGAEIGYIIGKPYWGRGLTAEAGHPVLQFCFNDLNLSIMKAYCDPRNRGSERVMQKLGMIYGGEEPYQLVKQEEKVMYRWYYCTAPSFAQSQDSPQL